MRALLDHAGALAVVFADDDQRAAHDAGGRQVRQRVGGDVRSDNGFPCDAATHRIHDRGSQHGGGGGFVGARLHVHAEFAHVVLGLHHDVDQVRNRRALITADIGHARLQQRLGDGQNAFAVKGLASAEFQAFDLGCERTFHAAVPNLPVGACCHIGRPVNGTSGSAPRASCTRWLVLWPNPYSPRRRDHGMLAIAWHRRVGAVYRWISTLRCC